MPAPHRPRSFEGFLAAGDLVFPDDGAQNFKSFQPRPDDIIISPWAKSGTTWLQQIVHALRSGGDLGFTDISGVVPWIEVAYALGQDLDAEQCWYPRAFKSHLSYIRVPKGGRYIVSLRDPQTALVSNYRFQEGWFFEPGAFTVNEYAEQWVNRRGGRDYWTHFASWWEQREVDNVLLLSFEAMKRSHAATVRRVADFVGINADPSLLDLVVEQSSLEFMLANKDKFDDLLIRNRITQLGALPGGGDAAKVTAGVLDEGRYELSSEILDQLQEAWARKIRTRFGLDSYEDVIEQLS